MKKIISLIVLAAMLVACMIPAAFAAEALEVSASHETAKIGEEVTVVVSVSKSSFAAFQIQAVYDAEALELKSAVDATGKFASGFAPAPEETPVEGWFAAFAAVDNEVEGALANLVFVVTEKAEIGKTYPITLVIEEISSVNGVLETTTVAGSITIDHDCVAGDWEVTKEPDCTEAGEKVQKCTLCGKVLATEAIPALGHVEKVVPGKAETCDEDGLTDGIVCERCGETLKAQEVIKAHDHEMGEWVVTKAPTTEEEGEKTRACKHTDHCDYTETGVVAKLDPELPPVTGDITPYIAMTAMTVVALIAAAGYVVLKRKAV